MRRVLGWQMQWQGLRGLAMTGRLAGRAEALIRPFRKRAAQTAGFLFLALGLPLLGAADAQRIEIQWPTPNPAWAQGRSIEAWVQSTVSGDPESGLFGCVRSSGGQFHEGLDIRPVARDRHGEPLDAIAAAMDGVVRHVNTHAGDSNYGRYIVIEHPGMTPAVYTLYAHLAKIEPGIAAGVTVARGQTLGVMGHSGGGGKGSIPRDRAHLHFEIGLMVTQDFPAWYAWKQFGSANEHGLWNGMNLMGIDPLDFLRQWRTRKVDNFQQYFDQLRGVVKVRIATNRMPDFIVRYPSLLRRPLPLGLVAGWELECNSTGLPFAWTPLSPLDVAGLRPGEVQIVSADSAVARAYRCKSLVRPRGAGYVPGADLAMVLQQVFGLR
jgi:murein DD-endopeptidase MepM/ murein hydrolase activator NlpD